MKLLTMACRKLAATVASPGADLKIALYRSSGGSGHQ